MCLWDTDGLFTVTIAVWHLTIFIVVRSCTVGVVWLAAQLPWFSLGSATGFSPAMMAAVRNKDAVSAARCVARSPAGREAIGPLHRCLDDATVNDITPFWRIIDNITPFGVQTKLLILLYIQINPDVQTNYSLACRAGIPLLNCRGWLFLLDASKLDFHDIFSSWSERGTNHNQPTKDLTEGGDLCEAQIDVLRSV